jgi:hypothetical protein
MFAESLQNTDAKDYIMILPGDIYTPYLAGWITRIAAVFYTIQLIIRENER